MAKYDLEAEITMSRKGVMVVLEYIGEGYGGDYDEEDPQDEPLLRFSVLKENKSGELEDLHDCSYCTSLSARLSDLKKKQAAKIIMDRVYPLVAEGRSAKRECEKLSWLHDKDLRKKGSR